MDLGRDITKTYPMDVDTSAQNVAYALAEFLDLKKNMITQTMRVKNGYMIQCKGDANAEWTKYLGMDAAISVELIQSNDQLVVTIGFDKWMEKLGIAAAGAVLFQPLLITAGIGALRQATMPQEIFAFIEDYLNVMPIEEYATVERSINLDMNCPHCGTANKAGAIYCKHCGEELIVKEKHCPTCDALLDGDEMFCPHCGSKLHS